MRNSAFRWLIPAILMTITFGCGKSTTTPTNMISDQFKSYCLYEVGSTWHYTDDSTQAVFEVSVEAIDTYTRFDPSANDYRYEAITMTLNGINNPFTSYELTAGNQPATADTMRSLMRIYMTDGSYRPVFIPQYPIGYSIDLGYTTGTYTNVELMDEMWAGEKAYQSVYHTRLVNNSDSTTYEVYLAKNYGMVKLVSIGTQTTTSWSLISSNLFQ